MCQEKTGYLPFTERKVSDTMREKALSKKMGFSGGKAWNAWS